MGVGEKQQQIFESLVTEIPSSSSKDRDQRSENAGYQGGIFWMKFRAVAHRSPRSIRDLNGIT
jgi:hypothetical protein